MYIPVVFVFFFFTMISDPKMKPTRVERAKNKLKHQERTRSIRLSRHGLIAACLESCGSPMIEHKREYEG